MAVELRHHQGLGLKRVQFAGAILPSELTALNRFHAANPDIAIADALHIVETDADFSAISRAFVDGMRDHYHRLFGQAGLTVCRRSAWMCLSPAARPLIAYWLRDRGNGDGFATSVRMVETLEDACDWLMLSSAEAHEIAEGLGFRVLANFDHTRADRLTRTA